MARFITDKKIMLFEYPKPERKESFQIDCDGVLWIDGYLTPIFEGKAPVRSMKKFELKIDNLLVVGKVKDLKKHELYHYALEVVKKENVNIDCCILLTKIID